MPHCGVSSTSHLLQCLRIRDELLVKQLSRFPLLQRVQRRNKHQIPGPLEHQRRAAKRKHGAVSAASGAPGSGQDFGALFGYRLTEAPRPDFEKSWTWEAPVHGAQALTPRSKNNGDWRPWMRSTERAVPEWQQEPRVADFLKIAEDPIDASRKRFEELLDTYTGVQILDAGSLRTLADFLQSAANEPDAQLTLRLVQWLTEKDFTLETLEQLAILLAQKLTLRTMTEDEGVAVFVELLQRSNGTAVVSKLLDLLPHARLSEVSKSLTSTILAQSDASSSCTTPSTTMQTWLRSLSASTVVARSSHLTSDVWAGVYSSLAQHYRISDMVDHFRTLNDKEVANVVLKHWVPHWVPREFAASVLILKIEFKTTPIGWVDGEWNPESRSNSPLVDLVGMLATLRVPHETVLEEVLFYWQRLYSPKETLRAIYELQKSKVGFSSALATSAVRSLADRGETVAAVSLLHMLHSAPVEPFKDVLLKYLQSQNPKGQQVWRLIDRWAELEGVAVTHKHMQEKCVPLPIVDFVHEMAVAWSKSPHIRPRVAFRRVWECYRFLKDRHAQLQPSISGAAMRSGVIQYIQKGQPLPKECVRAVLDLIETVEGFEVRQRADELVFDYWRSLRKNARRSKSASQRNLEKKFAMQFLEKDGTVQYRPYRPRIGRGNDPAFTSQKALFERGLALDAKADEDLLTEADWPANAFNAAVEGVHHDLDSDKPPKVVETHSSLLRESVDGHHASADSQPTSDEVPTVRSAPLSSVENHVSQPDGRLPFLISHRPLDQVFWRSVHMPQQVPLSADDAVARLPKQNVASRAPTLDPATTFPKADTGLDLESASHLLSLLLDSANKAASRLARVSRAEADTEETNIERRELQIRREFTTNRIFDLKLDEYGQPARLRPEYASPTRLLAQAYYTRQKAKTEARELHDRKRLDGRDAAGL